MPTIAVDTMGVNGDLRPAVLGAAAVSIATDIQIVLVGPTRDLQRALDETSYNPELIDVVDVTEKPIGPTEAPDRALRRGSGCSLAVAARLVVDGVAETFVSAGNPSALWSLCARDFSLRPNISRAAVAAVYPRQVDGAGRDPLGLILDVGATVRCDARDLVGFASLGDSYVRCVSKVESPRIGLLNMATRASAGGPELVAAHRLLERNPEIRFAGNVEGHELASGSADVVVCEGLLGNVVLKMLYGLAEIAVDLTGAAAQRNWRWRAGMAMLGSGVERLTPMVEYEAYAGSPILGFQATPIYCDPISPAPALANAIKLAAKVSRDFGPSGSAAV